MKEILLKWASYAAGAIFAFLAPTYPHLLVCTLAVAVDCLTSWQLGRRVKKKFPEKASASAGRISSSKFTRAGWTLIRIYSIVILAHVIEVTIFEKSHIYLPNIVAGAITFSQFLSILENESSCNDARWARWLSKFLCDKAERHFGIDFNDDGRIDGREIVSREAFENEKDEKI